MQRYLIKPSSNSKYSILLRNINNILEIIAITKDNHQSLYKQSITNHNLPQQLKIFFQTPTEFFNYLKTQKQQTILFIVNKSNNLNQSFDQLYLLQFQIPVANKIVKKSLKLQKCQITGMIYTAALKQIVDLQKISSTKSKIQSKKNKIITLQSQLTQLQLDIQEQQQSIRQTQKSINKIYSQKNYKESQIILIKQQFQQKNINVVLNKQKAVNNLSNINIAPNVPLPTASKIFDAMPNPCQMHPLGKHIQFHGGKKTLFLKNKNMCDQDLQGMIDYNWEQIKILSLGGNQLTNKSIQILNEISTWENVTHLYLFANKITDISKLTFLESLQTLSLYQLKLNQASCDLIINTQFNKMKEVFLNFDDSILQKCWIKIANSGLKNFPKLQTLSIDNPAKISSQTRVKLNKICIQRNIKMDLGNPSQKCLIF